MKTKNIVICAIAIACSQTAVAQERDLFKEYQAFAKKASKEYTDFRNKANKNYADFMKKAWEQFTTQPAIPQPKDESVPPIIKEEEKKEELKNQPKEDPTPKPRKDTITVYFNPIVVTPKPQPEPKPEPKPLPTTPKDDKQNKNDIDDTLPVVVTPTMLSFSFYGEQCSLPSPANLNQQLTDLSNSTLSNEWRKLSDGSFNGIANKCMQLKQTMNLNDWAYVELLVKTSNTCFNQSANKANLLAAWLLCQSGYATRLFRQNNRLEFAFASEHTIYNRTYFLIDNTRFYPFNPIQGNADVCNIPYPKERPISLWITEEMNLLYEASSLRTLKSKKYPDLQFNVSVNKNLVDFYNSYPSSECDGNFMTKWAMYANVPFNSEGTRQFKSELYSKIQGLSKKEAVERILNLVQTSMPYGYDNEIWGGDRAFFADETLYYPYCDCEDRSILFSRLVRDLVKLDVVLVYYPGHLATAVAFDENVNGDAIMVNGRAYTVCDPTYIGAPVGDTMPDMDNSSAKVILLR